MALTVDLDRACPCRHLGVTDDELKTPGEVDAMFGVKTRTFAAWVRERRLHALQTPGDSTGSGPKTINALSPRAGAAHRSPTAYRPDRPGPRARVQATTAARMPSNCVDVPMTTRMVGTRMALM